MLCGKGTGVVHNSENIMDLLRHDTLQPGEFFSDYFLCHSMDRWPPPHVCGNRGHGRSEQALWRNLSRPGTDIIPQQRHNEDIQHSAGPAKDPLPKPR
ncbi:hypothetical protein JZ751_008933 [Albula glossodonta]|uniref:Uncharacterized protein n=1 Tax=Albula glossodonta TaxID=121402 RepID=A0A8T2P8B2_9TELE|nr:hypothetical protein JZ751_008933 [Albula glossodonta]